MIVGAIASHLQLGETEPQTPIRVPEAGAEALAAWVSALKPSVVFLVLTDGAFNSAPKIGAPYTVGVADRFAWQKDGEPDSKNKTSAVAGNRALAEALVEHGIDNGFDLAKVEEWTQGPSTGLLRPEFYNGNGTTLVPLLINPFLARERLLSRFLDLGKMIGAFLESGARRNERIVVCAEGYSSIPDEDSKLALPQVIEDISGESAKTAPKNKREMTISMASEEYGGMAPVLVCGLIAWAISGATSSETLTEATAQGSAARFQVHAFN